MKLYRDTCDSSRTLEPVKDLPRGQKECRVYFDGKFAGKTIVPTFLLMERPKSEREARDDRYRYGFVAVKEE